jgi:hypothetical protein
MTIQCVVMPTMIRNRLNARLRYHAPIMYVPNIYPVMDLESTV